MMLAAMCLLHFKSRNKLWTGLKHGLQAGFAVFFGNLEHRLGVLDKNKMWEK